MTELPWGLEFSAEAEAGLAELRSVVDALIVVPNERLLAAFPPATPMLEAFRHADGVVLEVNGAWRDVLGVALLWGSIALSRSPAAVLGVMVPLLAMLLVALHFYFRQQETGEALREASAAAAHLRGRADGAAPLLRRALQPGRLRGAVRCRECRRASAPCRNPRTPFPHSLRRAACGCCARRSPDRRSRPARAARCASSSQ